MVFSGDVALFLTAVVSCLILLISFKHFWRKGNLPPGPTPLPILGNYIQLSKGDIVKSLLQLSKKYGEVFTVYLGSRPVIVVTGYKSVKEVYVDRGDDFLARGDLPSFDFLYKNYGVAFTSNIDRWKELRKFSLSTMRNFGMGKRNMENLIQEETLCLVTEFKKTKESLVDPREYISKASCNTIFVIMFGNRCDYEDSELLNLIYLMHAAFTIASSGWGQLYDMFPRFMRFIPGRHQKIFIYMKKLLQYVEKRVEMNKKTLDEHNPRDYIDAFLIKMEKIIFAGVETISTTLTYSLLLLMKYPDVLGVPRKTAKDITYRGYSIPMNTNVFPILSSVLKDPNCFLHPNEFNPKNFLDENGEFKKNDAFIPLAAGKRTCLGEGLSRMELFIFLITILQKFKLKPPIPPEDLNITPDISGLGNFPKPYTVAFIPQ
ncbi:cytochrome P450 2G1-like isoform X4 [Eleutherodactylus coqui]|uniref:cytochrome P450 2G1-like isoform X4 n=1 Tax=Eleutherodactylus coqui TaxID=57060 RepID=UPI003463772A